MAYLSKRTDGTMPISETWAQADKQEEKGYVAPWTGIGDVQDQVLDMERRRAWKNGLIVGTMFGTFAVPFFFMKLRDWRSKRR